MLSQIFGYVRPQPPVVFPSHHSSHRKINPFPQQDSEAAFWPHRLVPINTVWQTEMAREAVEPSVTLHHSFCVMLWAQISQLLQNTIEYKQLDLQTLCVCIQLQWNVFGSEWRLSLCLNVYSWFLLVDRLVQLSSCVLVKLHVKCANSIRRERLKQNVCLLNKIVMTLKVFLKQNVQLLH